MLLYEGLRSGGKKIAIVIDLGEAFINCGFAGETGPRCIIPSVIKRASMSKLIKVVQYNINTEELYSYLKEFIHILYFRHMLVTPRDCRVVVTESVLRPSHFRETLTRVLSKYFEVPSVFLAPSHLMALLTLGINSAMVLDCGYRESLVLPIYEGIPVLNCWGALPLGGKALHKELETQLLEQCTVDTGAAKGQSLPSVMGPVPEGVLEDIKVCTCFVSDLKCGLQIQAAEFNIDGNNDHPTPPANLDYPLDGEKILHVLGLIRDSVVEILFEQDNEKFSCHFNIGFPFTVPNRHQEATGREFGSHRWHIYVARISPQVACRNTVFGRKAKIQKDTWYQEPLNSYSCCKS